MTGSPGTVRLYDTMARAVVGVEPAGDALTMYTCGPTVYRAAHIGNLRTYLAADLARRAFEYAGVRVRQVVNITDVGHMTDERLDAGEDRMILAAGLEGRPPEEIAAHYTKLFVEDLAALGIGEPAVMPRASEHVPQMIELIGRLIERGHAYAADGNVYFDVRSFPRYGRLSGNTLDALQPGHRDVVSDPAKRDPADFVLWRAAGPGRVVRFPSPWGEGFPGWHIECSAMSIEHLGAVIDLHTGGVDNIFPHHEDEIAQSEGATGSPVVRHWLHAEHLLAGGRKMSKSAGNVVGMRELEALGHGDPLALRLLFLQGRYRAQVSFSREALHAAERALSRWRRAAEDAAAAPAAQPEPAWEERFRAAVFGDLDMPAALRVVADAISSRDLSPGALRVLLARWDAVLGLGLAGRPAPAALPPGAAELVERRERARTERDFAEADRIRDELAELGVSVEDTPDGPRIRRA